MPATVGRQENNGIRPSWVQPAKQPQPTQPGEGGGITHSGGRGLSGPIFFLIGLPFPPGGDLAGSSWGPGLGTGSGGFAVPQFGNAHHVVGADGRTADPEPSESGRTTGAPVQRGQTPQDRYGEQGPPSSPRGRIYVVDLGTFGGSWGSSTRSQGATRLRAQPLAPLAGPPGWGPGWDLT